VYNCTRFVRNLVLTWTHGEGNGKQAELDETDELLVSYLRCDDDVAMGGDVLEQLRVEGVDDEVAVQEDEHRVLPGLMRRGDEQRLGRQRARAGLGRRATPAPRRRPGLVDPGEADAVAPVVEHASRLRPHEQQKAVCKEQQRCRRGVHVNKEP
jgi:hypothetical protein